MKRYNYYNKDIKYCTQIKINKILIQKYYNLNGVLSSISVGKNFKINGLYLFYSNKFSNIVRIHQICGIGY